MPPAQAGCLRRAGGDPPAHQNHTPHEHGSRHRWPVAQSDTGDQRFRLLRQNHAFNMKKSIYLLLAASFLIMTACNNEKKSNEWDKKVTSRSPSENKQERN